MLSIESTPGPSCSSNLSALETDQRSPGKLAFHDTPTPNFSIRNFVLASRDKGIQTSWPFSSQSSQLFLKLGLKELLPPFEPPDLVRAEPLSKGVDQLERPIKSSESEIVSVTSYDQIERISTHTSRAEDIVSDQMASKICPVCKIFASTSNTTLNVHIDQCLSAESDRRGVNAKFLKPNTKARKKRLIVDIYTSAPRCTLEDLDRRNGTNWASESCVIISNEVHTKAQPPSSSKLDSRNIKCEGAVYIDSNGIKLGILSKFSDTSSVMSKGEFTLKEAGKDEERKSGVISKKKHFGPKVLLKNMRMKVQGKKFNSFKLLKAPIQAPPEGDSCPATHQKEDSLSNSSDAPEKSNMVSLAGKLATDKYTCSGKSPAGKDQAVKYSRSTEEMPTSPRTKSSVLLSHEIHSMDVGRQQPTNPSSVNGQLLKCTRLSMSSATSSSSKKEEIDISLLQKSDFPSMVTKAASDFCESAEDQAATPVLRNNFQLGRQSFLPMQVESSEKPTTFRNFRKHRSTMRIGRQRETSGAISGGIQGCTRDCHVPIEHANKKLRILQSNILQSATSSGADGASTCESEMTECAQREVHRVMAEQNTLMTECCDPETEFQAEGLISQDCQTNPSNGRAMSTGSVISEITELSFCSVSDPQPLVEEDLPSVPISEAHEKPMVQKSFHKEVMHHFDASHCEGANEHIQLSEDMEFRGDRNLAVQLTDCVANVASFQERDACLISHMDKGPKFRQEEAFLTSQKEALNHDHTFSIDKEPSRSLVLTASNICLPSLKETKHREPELALMERATASQGKAGFPFPSKGSIRASEGHMENIAQRVTIVSPVNEQVQSCDDKPFCCSCREIISRESQFIRQSAPDRELASYRGKQVSKLCISSRTSSSLSSYESSRTTVMTNSIMESPTRSISTNCKASSESCADAGFSSPSSHTDIPSPSKPILRLMGKDLMVINGEGMQPEISPSDFPMNGKHRSTGFTPSRSELKQDKFSYHHPDRPAVIGPIPSISDQRILRHKIQAGSFAVAPFHLGLTVHSDQHFRQNNSYKMPLPPSHNPCLMKEVFMINSRHEIKEKTESSLIISASASPTTILVSNPMPPTQFSCLPIDVSGEYRPFPIPVINRPL
ncbi:uncharacterized protein [Typha latifolia]|uniref:uncharacterized protein n=1 Tax=Typha latifolia TaxID=4733 RepID=UPI003C2CD227